VLGDHPVFPVLLSTDMARSRAFYHETLGLQIAREDHERIVFQCAAGTQLIISESTVGTSDTQTQAVWGVPDIRAELADLRARGIKIESYDPPDPATDGDGVADMGVQWAAWFVDPNGNVLALVQPKAPTAAVTGS
jgi:predicted enzyme related to lactoylglutathione lyase